MKCNQRGRPSENLSLAGAQPFAKTAYIRESRGLIWQSRASGSLSWLRASLLPDALVDYLQQTRNVPVYYYQPKLLLSHLAIIFAPPSLIMRDGILSFFLFLLFFPFSSLFFSNCVCFNLPVAKNLKKIYMYLSLYFHFRLAPVNYSSVEYRISSQLLEKVVVNFI